MRRDTYINETANSRQASKAIQISFSQSQSVSLLQQPRFRTGMPFSTSASANTVCSTNRECRPTTTAAAVAAGRSSTGEYTSP
ncbi:hypothetical protein V9T40_014859 [Parthenolecanium corni]|uniref:Uncharacterized protein n=1 Tax=Parthenolecanium corni TaxID=536013 RepID=A0AAN9T2U5_9HEMI